MSIDYHGELYIGIRRELPLRQYREQYGPLAVLPDGTPCDSLASNVFPDGIEFLCLADDQKATAGQVVIRQKIFTEDEGEFGVGPNDKANGPRSLPQTRLDERIKQFIAWGKQHKLTITSEDINFYAGTH
jgi:hypothetical protein